MPIGRWLKGALLFAGYLAGGTAAGQTPTQTDPTPRRTTVEDLSAYTPVQIADGASGSRPLTIGRPGDRTLSSAALDRAQRYSDALGGRALLIWQGGVLRHEAYAPGIGPETRFETFSMHKSVLGLLYGAALRDRIISSLDEPVGALLAEWRDDPRGRITVRQLLTMESGLSLLPMQTTAATALTAGQDAPPGSRFEYNGVNSQLAGVALDRALRAAGRGGYAAYLSSALLRPLGAGDAHLWLDRASGEPHFFAYCQIRARDWLRIGIMIDRGGRFGATQVIPADWIKAMTRPSALNPNYGLQMWIGSPWSPWRTYSFRSTAGVTASAPYSAPDLVFFDGAGGQRVYIVRSLDLVIVRIGEPSTAFDDSIIPNAIIAGLNPRKSRRARH